MNQAARAVESDDDILRQGKLALKIFGFGNALLLLLATVMIVTSFREYGIWLLLCLIGVQALLFFFVFLPVLVFQLTVEKKSLRLSLAKSGWSCIDLAGYFNAA